MFFRELKKSIDDTFTNTLLLVRWMNRNITDIRAVIPISQCSSRAYQSSIMIDKTLVATI